MPSIKVLPEDASARIGYDIVQDRFTVDRFHTPEDFLAFFKRTYGPTIAVYARLANDSAASAELDQSLLDLARDNFRGRPFMQWEYLLATASVT